MFVVSGRSVSNPEVAARWFSNATSRVSSFIGAKVVYGPSGVLRIPQHLFSMGTNFALDLTLNEDLSLRAAFQSTTTTIPLLLEGSRQG